MNVNTIKGGTIWSLASQVVEILTGILLLILIARILGPENYGAYQTILAIIILSAIVSDFGISTAVSRFIAKYINSVDNRNEYVNVGLFIKIIFTILIALILVGLIPYIELLFNIELGPYKYYIITIVILRSVKEFLLRSFQGARRLDVRALVNMTYFFCFTTLTVVLLLIGFNVKAILLSEIIVSLCVILMGLYKLKIINIKLALKYNKKVFLSVIKYSIPLFFITLSFYIYTKSDVLMIQFFIDEKAVGMYALATMIVSKVHIPLVAVGQSAAPAFSHIDEQQRANTFLKIFKVTFVLSLPISVGVFLVSDLLIVEVFGSSYVDTVSVLKLLCIFLFFYCVNSVMSPILDYLGFAKQRSILVGISAGTNIVLNTFFIPKFGMIGATYSTIITYTLYAFIVNLSAIRVCFGSQLKFILESKSFLIRLLLSVVIMFITVRLIDDVLSIAQLPKLIILITTGIMSYIIMIISTKTVPLTDILTLVKGRNSFRRMEDL